MRRSSRAAAGLGTPAAVLLRGRAMPAGKPLSPAVVPARGPAPLMIASAQPLLRALERTASDHAGK